MARRTLLALLALVLAGCGQEEGTLQRGYNISRTVVESFGVNETAYMSGTRSDYSTEYGHSTSRMEGDMSGYTETRAREDGRVMNIQRWTTGQRKGESIWSY